jgi:hypothetical protein
VAIVVRAATCYFFRECSPESVFMLIFAVTEGPAHFDYKVLFAIGGVCRSIRLHGERQRFACDRSLVSYMLALVLTASSLNFSKNLPALRFAVVSLHQITVSR